MTQGALYSHRNPPLELEVSPQIGEPTLGLPAENPDLSADYIFCNNLWTKNGVINPANRGGGLWPWGRAASAGLQPLTPAQWNTITMLGGNTVGPLTEGTYLYWFSANIQDTSGTSTNIIQVQLITSTLAQVMTLVRGTPVANGWISLAIAGSFWTPEGTQFVLQAQSVSGASVRGQEAGVSGAPTVMNFLGLGHGNFGN